MRKDKISIIKTAFSITLLQGKLIPDNEEEQNLLNKLVSSTYSEKDISILSKHIKKAIHPYSPVSMPNFKSNGEFIIEATKL